MNDLLTHLPPAEYQYLNSQALKILVVESQNGALINFLAKLLPKSALTCVELAPGSPAEARQLYPNYTFLEHSLAEVTDVFDVGFFTSLPGEAADLQTLLASGLGKCRQFVCLQLPVLASEEAEIVDGLLPASLLNFQRLAVIPGWVRDGEPEPGWLIYASQEYMLSRELDHDRWTHEIEKWDQYYASLPVYKEETEITRQFGLEILSRIASFLPQNASILEAGCGGGWQSLALARSGKFQVSMLDFSRDALAYARKVFAQEHLQVDFLLDNIANPGQPAFDLVFNAGVFEHYTFDEQVELLKGMASRSKKYVLVIVPNRLCYWYWVWRTVGTTKGLWPFGKEVPVADLASLFEAAGLRFVGQAFMAASWTESFINLASGLDADFRQLVVQLHRMPVIDDYQKGYLVAGLGCVDADSTPEIPGWKPTPFREEYNTSLLISTIADTLADKVFAEHQFSNSLYAKALELMQRTNELSQKDSELIQKGGELLEKKHELASSKDALIQTQAELIQSKDALLQTRDTLSQNQSELAHTQTELQQSRSELQQSRSELTLTQSDLHQNRTALAQVQTELQQSKAELLEKDSELGRWRSEAAQHRAKSDYLQAQIDEIKRARMWKIVQMMWQLKVDARTLAARARRVFSAGGPKQPSSAWSSLLSRSKLPGISPRTVIRLWRKFCLPETRPLPGSIITTSRKRRSTSSGWQTAATLWNRIYPIFRR